jgi:hypothetical protein
MVKEISGSFSPVTGTRSLDLNFDSGSRGDRVGEIQKSWSPVSLYVNQLQQEMCASQNMPVYINYQTI